MLSREYDNIPDFYRHKLLPLVVTTEVWIVINYLFLVALGSLHWNLSELLSEMLMLKSLQFSHMWYMPMIIGIYCVIPFLANLVNNYMTPKRAFIPMVIACALLFVVPTAISVLTVFNPPFFENLFPKIYTIAFGGIYVFYVLAGYFIAKRAVCEKWPTALLILGGLFCFISITAAQFGQLLTMKHPSLHLIWYDSAFILGMGICSFELFRRFGDRVSEKTKTTCATLSKISFGMYFVHMPIRMLLVTYVSFDFLSVPGRILILWIATFALSAVIMYILCKSQRLSRILACYRG